jgi:hypothetical protein
VSAREPEGAAHYATSTKHITGCTLAIVGPALALAGVLAPPLGLALVPPLYAIGAFVAPARRVTTVADVNLKQVRRSLERTQRRALTHVPTAIELKISKIATTINDILPRADTLGAGSHDRYVLRQCATDYLPSAVQAYLDLPRTYADNHVVADGKTALTLLSEQLDILAKQIDEIAANVNRADSDAVITNGRFLAEKFRRSTLDIDRDAGD